MDWLKDLDRELLLLINQSGAAPWLDPLMILASNRYVYLAIAIFLIIISALRKNAYFLITIFFILAVVAFTDATAYNILKQLFHRTRPCHLPGVPIVRIVNGCGGWLGFPSIHAAIGMVVTTSLYFANMPRAWWMTALTLSLLAGYSRIYLGVHYPLDVLAGFCFGAAVGFLMAKVRRYLSQRYPRLAIRP